MAGHPREAIAEYDNAVDRLERARVSLFHAVYNLIRARGRDLLPDACSITYVRDEYTLELVLAFITGHDGETSYDTEAAYGIRYYPEEGLDRTVLNRPKSITIEL